MQDETGTGVLPNISVRGLKASRSGHAQFLMDGVRGGAAVQYGPNNVSGVINLVTKPIPHKWQTEASNRFTGFEDGDTPLNDS